MIARSYCDETLPNSRRQTVDIYENKALRLAKGNFDSPIQLSVSAISELDWWDKNIQSVSRPINTPEIDLVIYSDASLEGWGGTDDIDTVGGRWSEIEMPGHINVLELHAAKLCLWALATTKSNIHVRLLLDNTTAICYINNMGGSHSEICNNVTKEIWF